MCVPNKSHRLPPSGWFTGSFLRLAASSQGTPSMLYLFSTVEMSHSLACLGLCQKPVTATYWEVCLLKKKEEKKYGHSSTWEAEARGCPESQISLGYRRKPCLKMTAAETEDENRGVCLPAMMIMGPMDLLRFTLSLMFTVGDPKVPVLYHVERTRTGTSFSVRSVKAVQHGKAIFICQASFQQMQPSPLQHQFSMPTVPPPEELLGHEALIEQYLRWEWGLQRGGFLLFLNFQIYFIL